MRSGIYEVLPWQNDASTDQTYRYRPGTFEMDHPSSIDRSKKDTTDIEHSNRFRHVPRSPSWWDRMTFDNWFWELGAASLCLCVLASIAGILIAYNNHAVPDLPETISINAIISFLASLAKASLMVLLAASIRQEKWLWFIGKPRPLNVVDAFEEASRGHTGPWNSFCRGRQANVNHSLSSLRALLAALVTLLALGFEPFIQQLVDIDVVNVPTDTEPATIRTPTSYNESVLGNPGGSSLSLNALIGAFGGASGAVPDPVCPTGNCTWPLYDTLALCTACEDMTGQVKVSGDVYDINLTSRLEDYSQGDGSETTSTWTPTYSFPHGNSINVSVDLELALGSAVQWSVAYPRRTVWPLNIDATPDSLWTYSWDNRSYTSLPVSPLLAMGYLDTTLSPDSSRLVVSRATACSFTPCVRTTLTKVQSGATHSTVQATSYGSVIIGRQQPDGSTKSGWTDTVNGTTFSVYDSGQGDVQGHAFLLIQALRIALEGNTTYVFSGYWYADPDPSLGEADSTFNATVFTQTSGPWSSAGQQAIDANGNFADIATDVGVALTGRFQQLQTSTARGTALRTQAIVVVRWPWMAYPLSLFALGVTALILTVLATRTAHMAVWKESTLPLLFRYAGASPGAGAAADASVRGRDHHTDTNGNGRPDSPNTEENVPGRRRPPGQNDTTPSSSFSFSNTIPSRPSVSTTLNGTETRPSRARDARRTHDSDRVSVMVAQAAAEQIQLRRHDSFWMLESSRGGGGGGGGGGREVDELEYDRDRDHDHDHMRV
ncbi:hypothetical protein PV08_10190 [Exophiala spinifera]|uniref:Uncharacterized protein n=1 Tax=Exophiala spinifera TaxID=91928 RepID=A0A0D1Y7J9_9EURO|nr:uncharacterized protein PV08_10190 [Exophiala spinifera]KIW10891.1 hypothetical protein PV08_10190 [Exophiala spinifera]